MTIDLRDFNNQVRAYVDSALSGESCTVRVTTSDFGRSSIFTAQLAELELDRPRADADGSPIKIRDVHHIKEPDSGCRERLEAVRETLRAGRPCLFAIAAGQAAVLWPDTVDDPERFDNAGARLSEVVPLNRTLQ